MAESLVRVSTSQNPLLCGKVKTVLAVVCPGQGAQTPGMLTPWLELPGVEQQLAEFSEAAGIDVLLHGTTSDADTIRDTAIAQPLIVATSLLAARAVIGDQASVNEKVSVVAGHSVGEFAATAIAGVLSDTKAVELVSHRARFMAQAAAATPTGMAAVIGGVPEEVLAAIAAAGLTAANVNAVGQVVAAGSLEGLSSLAENAPSRARVMPLKVAGAFHTEFMRSAHDLFAPLVLQWQSNDPSILLLSNKDGAGFEGGENGTGTGAEVLARLASQIVSPVRWDLTQANLAAQGITGLLELAPGGVLTGIAKRSLPGVELFAVKSASDIENARDFVANHAQ